MYKVTYQTKRIEVPKLTVPISVSKNLKSILRMVDLPARVRNKFKLLMFYKAAKYMHIVSTKTNIYCLLLQAW